MFGFCKTKNNLNTLKLSNTLNQKISDFERQQNIKNSTQRKNVFKEFSPRQKKPRKNGYHDKYLTEDL